MLKPFLSFLLIVSLRSIAFSQTANYKNEFGFRSDNDAYLAMGQDRYYTNGLFISFRHAAKQESLSPRLDKKIWEAEIGQKMYNAQSGYVPNINYIDRPFAAYLYGGGSISWFLKNEQVIKGSLQAGVIGPSALGEEAQKFLHKLVGFYELNGWQYQISNEVEGNASADYTRLISRNLKNNFDLSLNAYANAGSTYSGGGVGATIRVGSINALFNSVSTNSRISNSSKDSIPQKEFFFYAKPMINVVAYDATVSGGLYASEQSPITYGTKPFVFSQELGLMYAKNRWTVDFSIIFKTKEVKSFARAHQYGAITMFYKFN